MATFSIESEFKDVCSHQSELLDLLLGHGIDLLLGCLQDGPAHELTPCGCPMLGFRNNAHGGLAPRKSCESATSAPAPPAAPGRDFARAKPLNKLLKTPLAEVWAGPGHRGGDLDPT